MAGDGMDAIKHLVVVMMENRSFDNLLGFLYADVHNRPPINIPASSPGGQPTFDGLVDASPESPFWNPSNPEYFTANAPPVKVFATKGTKGPSPFLAPNHDPHEEFDHITFQILGPQGWTGPKMKGFLVDYITTDPGHPENANQVMECYSPEQVSVISQLAKNFAASDRWFCSTPNQTLPNRAFVHAGTSMGRVNNKPEPLYQAETIFEVLETTRHSWRVYNDTVIMSLVRLQFPQLWDPLLQPHFRGMEEFEEDCRDGTLPEYSFVEPSFQIEPNDEHPPHDVSLGEQFLLRWRASSNGTRFAIHRSGDSVPLAERRAIRSRIDPGNDPRLAANSAGEDAQQRPGQAGSDLWERLDPFGASYGIAGHCTDGRARAPHEAMDCSERLASGHANRSQKALPTHSGKPGKAQGLADVAAKI